MSFIEWKVKKFNKFKSGKHILLITLTVLKARIFTEKIYFIKNQFSKINF